MPFIALKMLAVLKSATKSPSDANTLLVSLPVWLWCSPNPFLMLAFGDRPFDCVPWQPFVNPLSPLPGAAAKQQKSRDNASVIHQINQSNMIRWDNSIVMTVSIGAATHSTTASSAGVLTHWGMFKVCRLHGQCNCIIVTEGNSHTACHTIR